VNARCRCCATPHCPGDMRPRVARRNGAGRTRRGKADGAGALVAVRGDLTVRHAALGPKPWAARSSLRMLTRAAWRRGPGPGRSLVAGPGVVLDGPAGSIRRPYSRTSKSHSRIRALRCRSHTAISPRLSPHRALLIHTRWAVGTPRQIIGVPLFAAYNRVCGCPRNDEQMQHVDSVGSGLVGGGGFPAQQVCSAALVTVCAEAWECR